MEINKPVASIIMLVFALILFFLFMLPAYQKSNNLQEQLIEKQAEYNGKSVYYAKISELLLGIQNRKDVLSKVDSALPSDFSFASLVYFFQQKGTENGLVIKSITFSQSSPDTKTKEVKDITFTAEIVGNYKGLKNFLAALENSARLFEVTTISFQSLEASQGLAPSQNSSQVFDFRLEVKTHTY